MQENVGRIDRIVRSFVGPAILGLGYLQLRRGHLGIGAASVALGIGVVQSAVTRVCPLNAALGMDTRSQAERLSDSRAALREQTERVANRYNAASTTARLA